MVVERGPQQLDKATDFDLEDHIIRRPVRQQLTLDADRAGLLQRAVRA